MTMKDRIDWNLNEFPQGIKDIVIEALCIYKDHLKIAKHIKESADLLYGGPHHCIVGRKFYGCATLEHWMQCRLDDVRIYLYKSPRWAT
ncbi:unnamed protein product [Mesocestoides corti]|uniref:Dynein light chain n=1 Tax=Mesocestoides corti TaxID=53468 RepID=A0A0R3UQT8_MESCO|nr:unnamed protein product [Mesocestoides corti]